MSEASATQAFLIQHLDLPTATGLPDARWEAFQLAHLNYGGLLSIVSKSRQVGWSWLAAAEAVGVSAIVPRSTCIFVSINLDEAGEKIRYAKQIIEALDAPVRPKLIIENRLEIELQNGSRLVSHPCRPVRGKARARVYLDEFAHYAHDRDIYQSVVPVISKGGVIRIGSSPLGASGMFWEIYAQTLKLYPGYQRRSIPWWSVIALCTNVREARVQAPLMDTDRRVRAFGTERLIEIYENMPLSDFQQEYECAWVDESIAWIDWGLIRQNQALDQGGGLLYRLAKTPDDAMTVIDDVARWVQEGKIEGVLTGGMDIGRRHDTTELILLGKSTTKQLPYRLGITLDRVPFDTQTAVLNRVMERLPVYPLLIDGYGIGMQIAETAVRTWGARVQDAEFTNANKEAWATEAKVIFQRGNIPIPADRDLAYQVHSIKRKFTLSKNAVFDCDANENHHADKFWALALAIWAAHSSGAAEDWINGMAARRQQIEAAESEADITAPLRNLRQQAIQKNRR